MNILHEVHIGTCRETLWAWPDVVKSNFQLPMNISHHLHVCMHRCNHPCYDSSSVQQSRSRNIHCFLTPSFPRTDLLCGTSSVSTEAPHRPRLVIAHHMLDLELCIGNGDTGGAGHACVYRSRLVLLPTASIKSLIPEVFYIILLARHI